MREKAEENGTGYVLIQGTREKEGKGAEDGDVGMVDGGRVRWVRQGIEEGVGYKGSGRV